MTARAGEDVEVRSSLGQSGYRYVSATRALDRHSSALLEGSELALAGDGAARCIYVGLKLTRGDANEGHTPRLSTTRAAGFRIFFFTRVWMSGFSSALSVRFLPWFFSRKIFFRGGRFSYHSDALGEQAAHQRVLTKKSGGNVLDKILTPLRSRRAAI